MSEPESYIIHRYKRATLHDLGGIEAHGKRLGDDLDHVDSARSDLNEFPVGHADLREIANARIAELQRDNAARKIAGLKKSRHKKQARELETAIESAGDDPYELAEIIGWPWDNKNVKPFTEGFISISHEWFLDKDGNDDPGKLDAFRSFAVGYIAEEFGDEVLYARLDLDEKTPHLSFVVAPEHENKKTKRRQLSHHSHRLFGMKEVRVLFDDEEPDPTLTRRSYEILQDRIADYAKREGLDVRRGERRADKERMQRAAGETVVKREHVTPARGREIAVAEAAKAAEANEDAQATRRDAHRERAQARKQREEAEQALTNANAARQAGERARRKAEEEREALAAREESMQIGSQAIIAEELAYAPPTKERAEGLTWGRNKPKSKDRRDWLSEKIGPARDWLVGFARSLFGFQQARAAAMAEHKARAEAIVEAEQQHGRRTPQKLVDILNEVATAPERALEIPLAWAVPADMPEKDVDERLSGMTNAQICDAYSPTRDARDFAVHTDKHQQYETGLSALSAEAERRGLDIERREHRPENATDPERAGLHADCAPVDPIKVVRRSKVRTRVR